MTPCLIPSVSLALCIFLHHIMIWWKSRTWWNCVIAQLHFSCLWWMCTFLLLLFLFALYTFDGPLTFVWYCLWADINQFVGIIKNTSTWKLCQNQLIIFTLYYRQLLSILTIIYGSFSSFFLVLFFCFIIQNQNSEENRKWLFFDLFFRFIWIQW